MLVKQCHHPYIHGLRASKHVQTCLRIGWWIPVSLIGAELPYDVYDVYIYIHDIMYDVYMIYNVNILVIWCMPSLTHSETIWISWAKLPSCWSKCHPRVFDFHLPSRGLGDKQSSWKRDVHWTHIIWAVVMWSIFDLPSWNHGNGQFSIGGWYMEILSFGNGHSLRNNIYFCEICANSNFIFRGTHVGQRCFLSSLSHYLPDSHRLPNDSLGKMQLNPSHNRLLLIRCNYVSKAYWYFKMHFHFRPLLL